MTGVVNHLEQAWLAGVFAPVADELDATDLAVTGALPPGLRGAYVRTGPNPRFEPIGRYHIFDGDGMLHAVTFADGRASYRNRWIRSAGLAAEERAGRALYGGMFEQVYPDAGEVGDAGSMKNTGNTHIVRHAGQLYALMEAAKPTRIGADLSTEGEWDFGGRLRSSCTAHPKIDPETGEMLFFGYLPRLTYHVVDATGDLMRSVPIETEHPTMMHDFVTTRGHVVFLDSPAVMDFASFFDGGPLASWRPELGTRVGVMPRDGVSADVRWFDMDNTWIAHFLNGYEDDGGIVVEGCAMDEFNFGLAADGRAAAAEGVLSRIRIDLATGAVTREALDDRVGDFPRINDDRTGLPNRYGYVAWYAGDSTENGFDALVKYDLHTGASEEFVFPGCTVGEFAFAPDPAGTGEDDGWLVGFVHSGDATASDLCVFDAHRVAAGPIARVHMPRRVPFGFHGNWFAAD